MREGRGAQGVPGGGAVEGPNMLHMYRMPPSLLWSLRRANLPSRLQ